MRKMLVLAIIPMWLFGWVSASGAMAWGAEEDGDNLTLTWAGVRELFKSDDGYYVTMVMVGIRVALLQMDQPWPGETADARPDCYPAPETVLDEIKRHGGPEQDQVLGRERVFTAYRTVCAGKRPRPDGLPLTFFEFRKKDGISQRIVARLMLEGMRAAFTFTGKGWPAAAAAPLQRCKVEWRGALRAMWEPLTPERDRLPFDELLFAGYVKSCGGAMPARARPAPAAATPGPVVPAPSRGAILTFSEFRALERKAQEAYVDDVTQGLEAAFLETHSSWPTAMVNTLNGCALWYTEFLAALLRKDGPQFNAQRTPDLLFDTYLETCAATKRKQAPPAQPPPTQEQVENRIATYATFRQWPEARQVQYVQRVIEGFDVAFQKAGERWPQKLHAALKDCPVSAGFIRERLLEIADPSFDRYAALYILFELYPVVCGTAKVRGGWAREGWREGKTG